MDLVSAVRDGISFFTHKATEGTMTRHARYGNALNRAAAAGMPFMGAYIVVRTPGNNGHGSIQAQVNYFLSYLDSQTPWWRSTREFFIQVDLEHWGYDDVGPQQGVEACRLLRAATGKWVVLYAPHWAYDNSIPGDDPLWASSYGNNPAVPYRQAYPGDGSSGWAPYSGRTPLILQYGSRLQVGSQPSCDANAFRGTVDQFRAIITGGQDMLSPEQETELLRNVHNADWGVTQIIEGANPATGFIQVGGSGFSLSNKLHEKLDSIKTVVDGIQGGVAPTQAQIDAAILKAMQDPDVQKGIGDAIASHLHVT
jgi:hypothetical protein